MKRNKKRNKQMHGEVFRALLCLILAMVLGVFTSGIPVFASPNDFDEDGVENDVDLDDDNDGILDLDECVGETIFLEDFSGYVDQATPIAELSNPNEETEILFQADTSGQVPPAGWYAVALQPHDWFSSLKNFSENAAMGFDGPNLNAGEKILFKAKNLTFISGNEYVISYKYWWQNSGVPPVLSLYVDIDGATGPTAPVLLSDTTLTGDANYQTAAANWTATADSTAAEIYIMIDNYAGGSGGRNFQLDDIQVEKTSCDTDGDGILNHLDLDSDNDGCLDAIEGGNDFVPTDMVNAQGDVVVGPGSSASNQNLGNAVDGDGVPNVANGGQDAGNAYNDTINACDNLIDSDNDGVVDYLDIDDDNDGILDVDEDTCGGNLVQNPSFEAQNFLDGSVGTVWAPFGTYFGQNLNTDQLTGWTYTTNLDGWSDTDPSMAAAVDGNQYIDVLGNNNRSIPPGTANVLSQVIPTEVGQSYIFSFYWGEDMGNVASNVSETNLTASVIDNATDTVIVDKNLREMPEGEVNGIRGPKHWNFYTVTFTATSVETRIQFEALATDPNHSNGAELDMVTVRKFCDTDGDGIPNRLDLDSDNDGCLDAIEGGGSFAPADMVNAQGDVVVGPGSSASNQNLGNAVDGDGVPNVANGGQDAGTTKDPNQKDAECLQLNLDPDTASGTEGTGFTVPNILGNDTLNGVTPNIGTDPFDVAVSQSGAWDAGFTLNPATGEIDVADTVSVGTYDLDYQVCVNGSVPQVCQVETVTITIEPDNPPVITTHDTTIPVGGTLDLLTLVDSAIDPEDGNITADVTVQNNGGFDPNVPGTYTITYTVTDSFGNTTTETATVTVDAPPVITTHDTTIPVGGTLDLLTLVDSAIDPEDGNITADVTVQNNGGFDPNVPGTYTVTYTVTDNAGNTATEMAIVTVNAPPVANDDSVITSLDQPIPINVLSNDTDTDGTINQGTVTITTQPQHGTVTVDSTTGEVNYTPDSGYVGDDSFEYTVADNNGSVSNVATVDITVTNYSPAINLHDDLINKGDSFDLMSLVDSANDIEDGDLMANVTLENDGGFNANVPGTYTITFKVTDSDGNEAVETATVIVNDPPIATDDTASTPINQPVTMNIVDNDTDSDGTVDASAVVITTHPAHGSVLIDPVTGVATYTPDPGYVGTDTFEYTVRDDRNAISNVGTATITVTNEPPVITTTNTEIIMGDSLDLTTLATAQDPEDGDITGNIVIINDGGFDNNVPGNYTITYAVTDSSGNTTTQTAEVKVKYANVFDPPSARKTVTGGAPEMEWKMVWINDGNAYALNTQVLDPIPNGTTYVNGSLTCDARGTSTTSVCVYDALENRVRWEGNIAPDPGGTDENNANNEVVIIFKTTVPPDVYTVENQAQGFYDQDADGDFQNDKMSGQTPILTDNADATNGTIDPTVWSRVPQTDEPTGNSSIGNYIWHDKDGDGKQDKDEKGLENIRVKLIWAGPDGKFGNGDDYIWRTDTNHNGHYLFENLPKGKYKVKVKEEDIKKYVQTYDPTGKMNNRASVKLGANDHHTKADFGYNTQETRLAKTGENLVTTILHMLCRLSR